MNFEVKKISELNDPAISEVNRLRKRDFREETGLTIVEGYPEVSRAVKASIPLKVLYICPEIFTPTGDEFNDLPIVEVTKDVFAKMAFGSRLKGILGLFRPHILKLSDLKLAKRVLIVVLEEVEKPGNLGAVLRSCDGAGVDAVIMCDGKTDINNHNVVRSSIGTVFTVPTVAATKEETLAFCKQNNIKIFAASAKTDKKYTECNFSDSTALIVGNEHSGLSPFWFEHADEMVKIPMQGEATCLNVAVSTSILIYEALRQRS